jgi:hypothetical protein
VNDRAALLIDIAKLIDAVADLHVAATLYSQANPTTAGRAVLEFEELLPVLAVPRLGEVVVMPSGRRGRVFRAPEHEGRSVKIELEEIGEALPTQEADPR